MQGVDVLHLVAGITVAFLFIRGLQALTEHYAGGKSSGLVQVERFLWGGPS